MPEIRKDHLALSVRCGDEFKIELESNPSTGYRWYLTSFNNKILKFVSSEFVPKTSSQIRGGGGMERFNFEAIKEGTTSIKLVYKRAWEREATKLDEFFVNVI